MFRTTPLTLLGLVAAFCFWIKEQNVQNPALEGSRLQRFIDLLLGKGEERETRSRKLSLLSLWAYLFSFVLFMTLGDKKFDRYILPIYPIVEILAALGLCQLLEPLRRRCPELVEGLRVALATGRFSMGEDAFGLKAVAKPSQGFSPTV